MHTSPIPALLCCALLFGAAGCGSDDGSDGTGSADAGVNDGAGAADGAGTSDGGAAGTADGAGGTADGAAGADTAATDPGPPYAVGVRTFTVRGAGGRDLPTEVWYPIAAGAKGSPAKYLNGIAPSPFGAIRGADPLPGKRPLIAFSHGNGGVRDQSVFLTEFLARHGYVVAAPEHVGNSIWDMKPEQTAVMTLWRPQDLKAVIDHMVAPTKDDPAWLTDLVDAEHIGVSGHSFGGYTSLAVAGLDVQVPPAYKLDCTKPQPQRSAQDQLVCPEIDKLGGTKTFSFKDARVDLAIPLAHAGYGWGFLMKVGKDDKHVPIVMMGATGDTLTKVATEAQPLYDDLSTPSAFVKILGGTHYSFANICDIEHIVPDGVKQAIGNMCKPGAKPTIEETFDLVQRYALAAADAVLKGDKAAGKKLAPTQDALHVLSSRGFAD